MLGPEVRTLTCSLTCSATAGLWEGRPARRRSPVLSSAVPPTEGRHSLQVSWSRPCFLPPRPRVTPDIRAFICWDSRRHGASLPGSQIHTLPPRIPLPHGPPEEGRGALPTVLTLLPHLPEGPAGPSTLSSWKRCH